jgi:hypothetical protein
MYRIVSRSSMHHVASRLSAIFLVAALSLFAAIVGSAAGSPGTVGKVAKHSARHKAKHSAPAGVVFGGVVTSEHAPVVIQISRDGRQVVEATMAVPCLFSAPIPGVTVFAPNYYTHLPISATGAFQEKGEHTESEAGKTTTVTGHVSGQFNRAMTSVTGTWSLAIVTHDATGAIVGQCDSGSVSYTAIQ